MNKYENLDFELFSWYNLIKYFKKFPWIKFIIFSNIKLFASAFEKDLKLYFKYN